jgi:transcriptional regulator with XRE-family HTH domain
MTCGERVKILRKDNLNLTLEKFGERLGVTKVAISNIENGNRALTEQMIKAICREFDVNEEWLRTGEGEIFTPRTKNELITEFLGELIVGEDNFKKKLIETLAQLEEDDWAVLEKVARRLTEKEE